MKGIIIGLIALAGMLASGCGASEEEVNVKVAEAVETEKLEGEDTLYRQGHRVAAAARNARQEAGDIALAAKSESNAIAEAGMYQLRMWAQERIDTTCTAGEERDPRLFRNERVGIYRSIMDVYEELYSRLWGTGSDNALMHYEDRFTGVAREIWYSIAKEDEIRARQQCESVKEWTAVVIAEAERIHAEYAAVADARYIAAIETAEANLRAINQSIE